MKALLVYPEYPDTFWGFKHAMRFISRKAAYPPLGLLTVSSMLPSDWERKLVDMNVRALTDDDIEWADAVLISGMIVQKPSAERVITRAKAMSKLVIGGGPMFTVEPESFPTVDYLILGEAENTLPDFLRDFERGEAKRIYSSEEKPDLSLTPLPDWDLVDFKHYATMCIQYSRGCPHDCEFCDIIVINGRIPRLKEANRLIAELDALYERGWRGTTFIVDDNFIGNKKKVKAMLPRVVEWMKERKYPFQLVTEASLRLADDDALMDLMGEAGFGKVFLGIESPSEESLEECNKVQNKNRDMVAAVKKIQNKGMEVMGGFIIGFDSDTPSIFEKQLAFIQRSGVATAMVGLLTAVPGTRLYTKLKKQGRILKMSSGDNTDGSLNFVPKMDREVLLSGYKKLLQKIYSHRAYYERAMVLLKENRPKSSPPIQLNEIGALFKSLWHIGVLEKGRTHYWRFLAKVLFRRPKALPRAVTIAIYGFHFRKITEGLGPPSGA
jgi:radical SAM superfamily enzyme YgiQ (UPF0313 family)